MRIFIIYLFSHLITSMSYAQKQSSTDKSVGDGCEACELLYAGLPEKLTHQFTIASSNEPGEPLHIKGVIYKNDGRTPAANVILYIYHTDNKGIYSPSTNQVKARRHGHLRGWIKTDQTGHYEFHTIKPVAYPNRKDPAHIHPIIKEEGIKEYWIDEYLFDDDPLLTADERARQEKRGGNGVIKLTKNDKGEWVGVRDIILGKNIPGYE